MKILILSASTGGGHMTAANALKSYITQNTKSEAEVIDTLEYISPILNKTVVDGYHYMALKAPKLFSAVYNTTNKENSLTSFVFYLNNQFSKKLVPLLEDFKPDVIISTHPFPTEMVSNLKEIGKISQPLVCIITDYAPHKTWINKKVDGYIVANEEMIEEMHRMGVSKEVIHPFGIPIDTSFYQKTNKETTLKELGLNPENKTILIMAGSMGATQIFKLYKNIINVDTDFQVIVITGNNRSLYKAFQRLLYNNQNKITTEIQKVKVKSIEKISNLTKNKKFSKALNKISFPKDFGVSQKTKPTKLLFFTNEVYKYMQAADLVITKPGGLTVSEALACNVPMALFNAIPGQEEENADFLIRNNMAIKLENPHDTLEIIKKVLSDPDELGSMKSSCESFDKSESNKNILSLLSQLSKN